MDSDRLVELVEDEDAANANPITIDDLIDMIDLKGPVEQAAAKKSIKLGAVYRDTETDVIYKVIPDEVSE